MVDGPSVGAMVASWMHDDSAVATSTHNRRAVVEVSKRCGSSDHPPCAAAVRLCMDNSAAKLSSHGEQDGQTGAMDTCGTAHTLDSAPAHITTRATASAMPAHFSHKSQPAEQAPPFDLLPQPNFFSCYSDTLECSVAACLLLAVGVWGVFFCLAYAV